MAQELIQNGQLDRQAAVEALREFLETTVRTAGFQLQVKVSVAEPPEGTAVKVLTPAMRMPLTVKAAFAVSMTLNVAEKEVPAGQQNPLKPLK